MRLTNVLRLLVGSVLLAALSAGCTSRPGTAAPGAQATEVADVSVEEELEQLRDEILRQIPDLTAEERAAVLRSRYSRLGITKSRPQWTVYEWQMPDGSAVVAYTRRHGGTSTRPSLYDVKAVRHRPPIEKP